MPGPSPKSILHECRDISEELQGGDTHSGPGDSSGECPKEESQRGGLN